jgi:diguanylate cyclase (GGDEF)-like protein
MLGVHANTVRAWSDAGRLRYYRINARGDRRYRMSDLQRFLAAAESAAIEGVAGHRGARRSFDPVVVAAALGNSGRGRDGGRTRSERHQDDLSLLDTIARLTLTAGDLDDDLARAAQEIRDAFDQPLVCVWELRGERLVSRAVAVPPGVAPPRLLDLPRGFGILDRALGVPSGTGSRRARHDDRPAVVTATDGGDRATLTVLPGPRTELAAVIPGPEGPWGVLLVVADGQAERSAEELALVGVVADALGTIVRMAGRQDEVSHLVHRAEALRRVASDIGSRLDLDRILSGLVDHAMVLFEADRAAVFLRQADGSVVAEVSRGLSTTFINAVRDFPVRSLPSVAIAERRPLFAVDYRNDPRAADVRAAVIQEGFDTICTAPLVDGTEILGLLNVYHDQPHPWSTEDVDTIAALATQASVAIRTAQNFQQMARWTAQLQSIQQLGARLNHLTSVADIGHGIATELRQLIDYHNVRVYRLVDTELIPVAMLGQVGEYVDETPDQLRVRLGEGITGWVAEHRIAQNLPDAAADPRANTIPGTDDDLDESMLLAPMTFEDRVLGVLVLSKLGLHQFSDDDLRLLVIYASFAAQAMANAETTERLREQSAALERQLRSQRELIQITESILTTLERRTVLESITDRLGGLIACDNIAIEVVDPSTGLLTPLTARGIHADHYLEPWEPGETGIATWVVEHNEPVYIDDERHDERVNHFREEGAIDGSLIVVPLRGRSGAIGVLTIERLGVGNAFAPEEFDLVKLFAAQVSIAIQNAEVFRAVEIRAQSDDLTGVLNHGTFQEYLARSVAEGTPFGLIMLDLDDFRHINNSKGHQAGDEILRGISQALVHAGRDSDLVFRYGGDEFVFLLPHADQAGTMSVAERAGAAVGALDGTVTASIGVASFPADGDSAAEVLLAADRACFVAKRSGRGRVATAADGLALAAEFTLQRPTPVDSASIAGPA